MDLTPLDWRSAAPLDETAPGDLTPDWAALVGLASARAAASPTAVAHARLVATDARPGGSFAPFVAVRLTGWRR